MVDTSHGAKTWHVLLTMESRSPLHTRPRTAGKAMGTSGSPRLVDGQLKLAKANRTSHSPAKRSICFSPPKSDDEMSSSLVRYLGTGRVRGRGGDQGDLR